MKPLKAVNYKQLTAASRGAIEVLLKQDFDLSQIEVHKGPTRRDKYPL